MCRPPQGTVRSLGWAGGLCPPSGYSRVPGVQEDGGARPHILGVLPGGGKSVGLPLLGLLFPLPWYGAFPDLWALKFLPSFSLDPSGSGSLQAGMADSFWAPLRSRRHSLHLARGDPKSMPWHG